VIYYVDIDDTICQHDPEIPLDQTRDYNKAIPIQENIDKVNNLYDSGHEIVYWTARGSRSGKDWHNFTEEQLLSWGCKFHELKCDKPYYDKFIEDRSMLIEDLKVFISHRGNLNGCDPDRENSKEYIDEAIAAGYDVEIDVRYIGGELWLGHDQGDYKVGLEWLLERSNRLWIHTKNVEALQYLLNYKDLRLFYHEREDQTIISDGHIWTHNLQELTTKSIIPLLDWDRDNAEEFKKYEFYGVCSDYIEDYKKEFYKL
jgi:hypothetical protein